ncbi:MAG: glycosyl transferase, partial [Candidatus Electrothrix sp. ATG1]|nr:glycosyl transferase [Candidatus Electrothrix sp. ATG1]
MKVLHLNTFDIRGGAARAAYRIHTALRTSGIQSEMLVACKDSFDNSVKAYDVPFLQRKRKFSQKILTLQKTANPTFHSCNVFPTGIYKEINQSDADVVHFHWIGYDLISIAEVRKISKPIIWTLHDMWAFCGAEHYDNIHSPGRYLFRYTRKNRTDGYKGKIDVDAWVWRLKKRYWHNINFTFVSPSRWLGNCLSESALFSGKKYSVIPNCINTDAFRPKERRAERDFFQLPQDKKLILFGADGGGVNPLKGYHLLKAALEYYAATHSIEHVECAVFGGAEKGCSYISGIPVTEVGR